MAKYSDGLEDKLDISQVSVTVLESRYLTKDLSGKLLETGEDMFRRVAKDIACADALYLPEFKGKINPDIPTKELYKICRGNEQIEKREQEFFDIMSKNYFLPNSPTLMNAGKKLQQLSACFVLPIEDSIEGIFNTKKYMAIVHKTGGGTGFSFSILRPNGAFIHSTNGYSPGPLSFLFTFNEDAGQITQGGKRRGANMGILRANHPDALCLTRVKEEEGVLKNFNLSIAFTDKEIEAIRNDDYILMEDPRKEVEYTIENARKRAKDIHFGKGDIFKTSWRLSNDEKSIIDNYSEKEIGKVEDNKLYLKAKSLFDIIIEGAWKKGEPGIIFIDKINKYNPTPGLGDIEATNPCGEQPLLPYESCNLGSINLSKMVDKGKINKSRLEKTIRSATRFLDNVIDRNNYPLKEINDITKANRKIGLGIMGFAHMLVDMGVSYQSQEAVDTAEYVMKFVRDVARNESQKLAEERGAFSNFDKSIYKDEKPLRNSTTTTLAPTGTIGIIASTSQGVEPIFKLVTLRKVKDTLGKDLVETDRAFKKYLQEKDLYDEDIMQRMEKEGLGIDGLLLPKKTKDEIKRLFVTAHDVVPAQHIKVQAAFQKYTDNAVSKTINMPAETTKDDIAKAYLMAHEIGCKGLTIYRDKSREFELLTGVEGCLEEKVGKGFRVIPVRGRDLSRVRGIQGITYEIKTGCGPLFVTVNYDEKGAVELFSNMNPPGGCAAAQTATAGVLSSFNLHRGESPERIAKHLRSTQCPESNDLLRKNSCPQAMAKALDLFQKDFEKIQKGYTGLLFEEKSEEKNNPSNKIIDNSNGLNSVDKLFCPECNSRLEFSGGCKGGLCNNCGFANC